MLITLFLGHPVVFAWQKKWWFIPDQWSPITRSEIGGQLTLACPKLQDTVRRPKPDRSAEPSVSLDSGVRQEAMSRWSWLGVGPGRAMLGMCGQWDPVDARSEPLLAWQPGDGWPSRHRPGCPDTHKLICQAGLFRTQYSHSAQHYQHKDALSRLLREQYYAIMQVNHIHTVTRCRSVWLWGKEKNSGYLNGLIYWL